MIVMTEVTLSLLMTTLIALINKKIESFPPPRN